MTFKVTQTHYMKIDQNNKDEINMELLVSKINEIKSKTIDEMIK